MKWLHYLKERYKTYAEETKKKDLEKYMKNPTYWNHAYAILIIFIYSVSGVRVFLQYLSSGFISMRLLVLLFGLSTLYTFMIIYIVKKMKKDAYEHIHHGTVNTHV